MSEILMQTPSPALAAQGAHDAELVAALRRRDEAAFVALVERYGPMMQRDVVVLRDVEGWEPEEVCDALGLSEGNQRVLLHRGRTRVRAALERHLDPELSAA